ncbi:MAG TPA: hypothetical protein VHE35_33705, partial [Kofleriaceae bacterium]|nr:hypothetical protein [Kofleriaceae bacterium]
APPLPAGARAATAEARAKAYQAAAFGDDKPDTDAMLWGLARTQAVDLGKDADALRTLELLVRKSPGGAQIEAVLWLRVRLLCAHRIDETCRAAAHTYVAKFPGTARGALATRITDAR